ncbi:U3 snoRNP protein [Blastocladiella emersonii ATCC 22665]|nr:U3 snoRNP protein [Blastocladiella emersonii ATCC 22665]
MKSDFRFSNLCGTVYKQGNLVFSPDGNCLYSPVGNRVTCFDLVNSKSFTFNQENRKNVAVMALSPNGILLLTIDEDGHALLVNTNRRIVIASHNFKHKVRDAAFSPDGKWILVTAGQHADVWKTPGFHREFAPFIHYRTYTGHHDDVVKVSWRADSKMFMTCARDMTARLYTLHTVAGYEPITFGGHKDTIVNAWFATGDDAEEFGRVYTVGRDGSLFMWDCLENIEGTTVPSKFGAAGKHYFNVPHAKVISACFHRPSSMVVIGFNTGIFGLWELPSFSSVHSLSIGQFSITSTAINATGEWLAFGAASAGQLVVWEWQSESYVIKQQGHAYDLTSLAYAPQGALATGGDDAKVKLWNDAGLCYVTLDSHTGPVSGLQFAKNGRVLFSGSLDGTVRAWDMTRYRNFKTYTTPNPLQFGCIAVDESGDLVTAGSVDSFEVFVWAVQTGKLLEVLPGHTGPVSCMEFAGNQLVTGSWDRTLRVWNVFDRSLAIEALQLTGEVLALAVRGDNQHVAAATLDGMISIWHLADGKQVGLIDGRRDLKGGRKSSDLVSAENAGGGKCFTSVTYSADGEYLLAGGRSKYVCIYHVASGTLVRRFQVSHNLALEGIKEELNSRRMTEAGSLDMLERNLDDEEADKIGLRGTKKLNLPGAARGDLSERTTHPEIKTSCVRFAPTGRAWAAASTEGLLIYSLDDKILFDPFDLDLDITPATILDTLRDREYATALLMALRLNEASLIQQTLEAVPPGAVDYLCKEFPRKYLDPLLRFLANHLQHSTHLEFLVGWCAALLKYHARFIRDESREAAVIRLLKKTLGQWQADLGKVCDENVWTLKFLLSAKRNTDIDAEEDAMDLDGDDQA